MNSEGVRISIVSFKERKKTELKGEKVLKKDKDLCHFYEQFNRIVVLLFLQRC